MKSPIKIFFFLLIHNNEKNILTTLKSRCLVFKINFSFNESILITNKLINGDVFDQINHNLLSYYSTPGDIINLINLANQKKINLREYFPKDLLKLLIDNGYYKKNKLIKDLLINFIELHFLNEYKLTKTKNSLLNIYKHFLNKIYNAEKFNLDEESLFLEFKSKLLNG